MPGFNERYEPENWALLTPEDIGGEAGQLEIVSDREAVAMQEPEFIRALGHTALENAKKWLAVAYMSRDELADQGYLIKTRKKVVDLDHALPELGVWS